MNYEKNTKYFLSNDKHFFAGVIIIGCGVVLFGLWALGFSFLPGHMSISAMIMIAGAIVAFAPLSRRASEGEIDNIIEMKTANYAEQVAEDTGLSRMLNRRIKPCTFGGHVFTGENVLVRRGRDDRRYRSSLYTASALIFTDDGVYISQKTFSLVDEKESEASEEFFFSTLKNVCVEEEELALSDGGTVKVSLLVFEDEDGKILRVPAKSSYALVSLCDDVNRAVAECKNKR